MEIVRVTIDELKQYRSLARKTFLETYESNTDPQQLKDYMEEHFSNEASVAELAGDECAVFFLKDDNGETVGYCKLRWDTTHELLEPNAMELQRIYVLGEYQGNGYGKLLLKHAEQYGREHGFDWIWLCVYYENHGAIRFYEREGWVKFGIKEFKFGDGVYLDPVMKKKL